MIGALVPYIIRIKRSYQSNDIIDRLNYHYTAIIISLSAITLAATQYVGKPIQCWVPPEFTGAWEKYAETYCFVKGSYFLPIDDEIDNSYLKREKVYIGYYQWVPLILAFQAILFYLPSFLWKAFNFNSGINIKSILNSAALIKKKIDKNTRLTQIINTSNHLLEALELQKELKTSSFLFIRLIKKNGVFLSLLYIFTKLLYVLNIILQFVILNAFLGSQYTFWGIGILSDIWDGKEWNESGHFPRVTLCDFNVRVLGNIHRWTIQCVLMINMFNEKIFIFFWFWFILVGILSSMSLIYWLLCTFLSSQKREYILKYLRCTGSIVEYTTHQEEKLIDDFIRSFLRTDGVFILRLIQTNGNDLLVGEIIATLFNKYQSKKKQQPMIENLEYKRS